MSTSVSIRLPDNTAKALEELARATDRPKTYFIEKALESYLAEYADYQVALDRLRDKDDPIVSSAELRGRVGRRRKD
ncbi:MAG: ribbon-helix-helix domain-containing protein [Thermoanaerobaculia bacterium]